MKIKEFLYAKRIFLNRSMSQLIKGCTVFCIEMVDGKPLCRVCRLLEINKGENLIKVYVPSQNKERLAKLKNNNWMIQ